MFVVMNRDGTYIGEDKGNINNAKVFRNPYGSRFIYKGVKVFRVTLTKGDRYYPKCRKCNSRKHFDDELICQACGEQYESKW